MLILKSEPEVSDLTHMLQPHLMPCSKQGRVMALTFCQIQKILRQPWLDPVCSPGPSYVCYDSSFISPKQLSIYGTGMRLYRVSSVI